LRVGVVVVVVVVVVAVAVVVFLAVSYRRGALLVDDVRFTTGRAKRKARAIHALLPCTRCEILRMPNNMFLTDCALEVLA
jgi:hypothetical protein